MIALRTAQEIETIRKAGAIVAATLDRLRNSIRSGITTEELDAIARKEILAMGGYPAFKGYKGYPANICVSPNEVVVHGIPSARRLKEGDIVSLDIGVRFRDYFADGAATFGVGNISELAARLIQVTRQALSIGISNAICGRSISDVSAAIQAHVESNGFSVVRAFVGHGIGAKIHEEPEIPNYRSSRLGPVLQPGMVLAIEPMVNAGTHEVEILEDGWTAVTKDRRLSAHFEHTIVVKEDGPEILTI
ncbi:MAG: type I methionyl aminopeptidase [Candidatus Omnitrophica bacterium]|nr:type I methionyl aminopeptidase [Candidatus Omnitrophota bacterium]